MKKIGILFGQERSFPNAFIERIKAKKVKGVTAEAVSIDKVIQGEATEYAVIIDRISQDVPFYRSYLKNAAAAGTAVINNPFWWSADEKFFNNVLAKQIGVPVPKTVLLPSNEHPEDTSSESFTNLEFPLDWQGIFDYIGFPAYMKPHSGGGWKSVYKLDSEEAFFAKYNETGRLVMMLQEEIRFDSYFRCYCIGCKHVKVMHYEPRNPHLLRYEAKHEISDKLLNTIKAYTLQLNQALGYDFNTVEFAIRDGIPYAIDFCNPAPDADKDSVGEENFEWVVETAADYAIERALAQKAGMDNLTWGTFVQDATRVKNEVVKASKKTTVKRAAQKPKKTAAGKVKKASPKKKKDPQKELMAKIGKASPEKKDDLKQIKGVGPQLEKTLNNIGIYTFKQVSKMKKKEYEMVDSLITSFRGRGQRDDWAGQAKKLGKKK